MSESITSCHGLEAFLASGSNHETDKNCIEIQIRDDLGHINLRGDAADEAFLSAVAGEFQQDLPLEANTISTGEHRVYWLGPDEWQIVTAIDKTDELAGRLCESLATLHASVSQQSGGQVVMHIRGPGVRDLLAKGSTLDLSAVGFGLGTCAQSGLAKANMLIGCIGADPVFEIVVRRSFADYVARWLHHSASGFGARFTSTG